jgi:hypothetical protein
MTSRDWQPGQRLRCVDGFRSQGRLVEGHTYTFRRRIGGMIEIEEFLEKEFFADRFKPVVRVKAVCVPSLGLMVRRANVAFANLSPEQQTVHWEMQRRSWVRGEMALGADR